MLFAGQLQKSKNKFCGSHPPPTAAVSKKVLLCELLARLELFTLVEKRLRRQVCLA